MPNLVVDKLLAKVTRAEQHIQDFDLGIRAFFDTNPYAVAVKEDANVGKRIYYVSKVDATPDALTAIAADIIQNLRSALDNLAYQLVLDARGGAKPDWKVYYPIAGSAAYCKSTRGGTVKGIRQEVIDAIDATEPYKGGKGHALWQLKELSNSDKHELLIGTGPHFGSVDISVDFEQMFRKMPGSESDKIQPIFLKPADPLFPLKMGDELYIEPINKEVAQNRRFRFDVSFHAPGVTECEPAIKTAKDMTNLVGAIIRNFRPFFG